MSDPISTHGWTAVPRDAATVLNTRQEIKDPSAHRVQDISIPQTPLANAVTEYAKRELSEQTFNHSMRVYFYGRALLLDHFPTWHFSPETYLLACLLHDIGTTDTNLSTTLMSFEFYGGILALQLLTKELHAPREQAESVAEAVFRHQDLGTEGKITVLGQVLQMATVFDNMGLHDTLISKATIEDVVKHYPRNGWSACFAATIRKENGRKPWAHTTKLGEEDFPRGVEGNEVMRRWD